MARSPQSELILLSRSIFHASTASNSIGSSVTAAFSISPAIYKAKATRDDFSDQDDFVISQKSTGRGVDTHVCHFRAKSARASVAQKLARVWWTGGTLIVVRQHADFGVAARKRLRIARIQVPHRDHQSNELPHSIEPTHRNVDDAPGDGASGRRLLTHAAILFP